MLKALITGGAGFVGLHLANRLLVEGCTVHLVDNFPCSVDDAELSIVVAHDQGDLFLVDMLDKNKISSLNKDYDLIFHLAAIVGVANVLKQPYDVLYNNLQMLGNVIHLARLQSNLKRLSAIFNDPCKSPS